MFWKYFIFEFSHAITEFFLYDAEFDLKIASVRKTKQLVDYN